MPPADGGESEAQTHRLLSHAQLCLLLSLDTSDAHAAGASIALSFFVGAAGHGGGGQQVAAMTIRMLETFRGVNGAALLCRDMWTGLSQPLREPGLTRPSSDSAGGPIRGGSMLEAGGGGRL